MDHGQIRRTFVYIDGFNLYNRALKNTPYKWLNPRALVEGLLDRGIVTVIYGKFLSKPIRRPALFPPPQYLDVHSTQEKGSDVNLASHLLFDGFRDAYDVAVVISMDTDLREPIRLAVQEMGKIVGVVCPQGEAPGGLSSVASFVRHVTPPRLASAQFSETLYSRKGKPIKKPAVWSAPLGKAAGAAR